VEITLVVLALESLVHLMLVELAEEMHFMVVVVAVEFLALARARVILLEALVE
jgi:hypothetical protein